MDSVQEERDLRPGRTNSLVENAGMPQIQRTDSP